MGGCFGFHGIALLFVVVFQANIDNNKVSPLANIKYINRITSSSFYLKADFMGWTR
jgi:hypothetical protein